MERHDAPDMLFVYRKSCKISSCSLASRVQWIFRFYNLGYEFYYPPGTEPEARAVSAASMMV